MELNWDDIKDAVSISGLGNEIPPKLRALIERYMKLKSVFHPEPFTTGDWANCALIYQITKSKEKANG